MALTGYNQKYLRRNGGLKSIALADIDSVESAVTDQGRNAWAGIALKDGKKFAVYDFYEDEAEYRENVYVKNGNITVVHELSFTLDRMGGETSVAVGALCNAARNGLAAIVTTANDDTFLVGYSRKFRNECPLRLSSAKGNTGSKLAGTTGETIVLRGEDTSKALPYTGSLAGITA